MNATKKSKKASLIPWQIVVLMIAATVLNAVALIITSLISHALIIEVLYYLCKMLSLFCETVGLGIAIFHLAGKEMGGVYRALALTEGCTAITRLTAAVLDSLIYMEIDFAGALGTMLVSALLNILISLAVHVAVLLFVWLLFFRRQPACVSPCPRFRPQNALGYANVAAIFVLLAYQLFGLVPETVGFILDYYPNIYPSEIDHMVFDFAFTFISLFLGYVLLFLAQWMLMPEDNE